MTEASRDRVSLDFQPRLHHLCPQTLVEVRWIFAVGHVQ